MASARRVGSCLLRGRMERVTPPCLANVCIEPNPLRLIVNTCTWAVDKRTLEEDERNAVWTDGIDERTFCSVLLAEGTEAFQQSCQQRMKIDHWVVQNVMKYDVADCICDI
ncbi:hypothetical protein JTB14_027921 [Gonioctena quinquepunctata]|nr:hypothetical protein JTB14_027921 [Gonioctena quinquepunctata]